MIMLLVTVVNWKLKMLPPLPQPPLLVQDIGNVGLVGKPCTDIATSTEVFARRYQHRRKSMNSDKIQLKHQHAWQMYKQRICIMLNLYCLKRSKITGNICSKISQLLAQLLKMLASDLGPTDLSVVWLYRLTDSRKIKYTSFRPCCYR